MEWGTEGVKSTNLNENMERANNGWRKPSAAGTQTGANWNGYLKFTASLFAMEGATSEISTTFGAASDDWTLCTTDNANMDGGGVVEKATGAKGLTWQDGGNAIFYTSDSGDNWTAAAGVGAITEVWCASMYGITAVIGCDKAAVARGIYFSTDSGANFTLCSTGPATDVEYIDMFDANTGYAVDSAGNIWKTINAGDDWTDTGHNVNQTIVARPGRSDILCLSATTILMITGDDGGIAYFYDNGTGISTKLVQHGVGSSVPGALACSNILKGSDGYMYFYFLKSRTYCVYRVKKTDIDVNADSNDFEFVDMTLITNITNMDGPRCESIIWEYSGWIWLWTGALHDIPIRAVRLGYTTSM